MTVRIQWNIGKDLTPLHAATQLALRGDLADAKIASVIERPVEEIRERLELSEIYPARFWQSLIEAYPEGPLGVPRITQSLVDAGCTELTADTVATAIQRRLTDIRRLIFEVYPRLEEQLELRSRPLKEQWEACGSGLMRSIGKLSHPDLIINRAKLILVHPVVGGACGVVPEADWGWMEAVLTNVIPGIPETVRLGWLLATLSIGHYRSNRLVQFDRLPQVAAIASVPIVLQAAADMELVEDPEKLLSRAIAAWEIPVAPDLVLRWWNQQREGAVPFAVGIKALDRMLQNG